MESKPAKICVPVCVSRAGELREAIVQAAKVADIIELRLDYLDDGELIEVTQHLQDHLRESNLPKILTFRSVDQGGHIAEIEQRRNFWLSLSKLPKDCLIDLEFDLAIEFAQNASAGKFDLRNAICSFHDFAGVPKNLETIYEQMAATPARILKIAVQARDATDCLPIFDLLERAQSEGREMMAIAMGPAGVMTRILGPSRGSFLTYGSLDDESATAPGQVTAKDLREIYRFDQIDRDTEIFGIIGKPVGHSLSRQIHNAAFAAANLNAVYLPFEVTDANEFLRRMVHPKSRELDWNLRGLSVTAPLKSAVMDSLDWIDTAAKAIGAINTIVIRDGEMRGYNTDALAFISPLRRKFESLEKLQCAIVGAGGGARAAAWALREAGAKVSLLARDAAKAQIVAEELGVDYQPLARANFEEFQIVINATPLGTRGSTEDQTVATAEQLRSVRLAYDLVYNPLETRFLREARAAGAQTLSGIEMLIAQAIEQFKLWTGAQPDIEVMREAAMNGLQSI